ncbi:preprotein translocase subunit SecF [Halodesulfurarchaeum formicicum]|uniref:Protein-export membrane protein SecF n=1 Tax=Halodesulfurarchaeum formicicum TaxID=1873524 RepID=A0A1D8S1W7_9EURY|nr:protein translocase subunit SecF [Halodesulfurarchaeum formicicum]AOW79349.1 preprotein translocase subunit SecF [Halodesulfurarchaeum formicicum]APE94616.1 preprotein translocase subunit SecF [Halodesulfurarchaeum formicicum]
MPQFEVPEVDYSRYSNRQLVAVPLAVLVVAVLIVGGMWAITGSPAHMGVDFAGGSELTVESSLSQADIAAQFDEPVVSVQGIEGQNTYVVTFETANVDSVRATAESADGLTVLGSGETSAIFGDENKKWAIIGLAIAFLGMSVLAFALFRTFIPSLAIVVSAFSDMLVPIAVLNLLGIRLSLGTVAALLMLIGYSVDSDILLTNHVLRRSGDFYESTYRAMQTGVTMTVTSIAAMAVMAVAATFFGIDLMASIGLILVIGLTTDLLNTYMFNVSLLRWYKYEGVAR